MPCFVVESSFVPDYEEDMKDDTNAMYRGGIVYCAPPEQQLLNIMFCEQTYLGTFGPSLLA